MSALASKSRLGTFRAETERRLRTRLVRGGRIPRHAYQHYFIEDDGLHSRIHLQNFFSTMFPHVDVPVEALITAHEPGGNEIGRHRVELPPFGSLFLEIRDLLSTLGSTVREGSLTIDLRPPDAVLEELSAFPLDDPWDLRLQTPFWMAYYDDVENYMYVHSISTYSGAVYGVDGPLGWIVRRSSDPQGSTWRSGRLLDAAGLRELQVVLMNHSAAPRSADIGLFDADSHDALWSTHVDLAPHELHRVRIDAEPIAGFAAKSTRGQFQIGVDPLPTPNGKPYVLMRYGDGPLSLHHG